MHCCSFRFIHERCSFNFLTDNSNLRRGYGKIHDVMECFFFYWASFAHIYYKKEKLGDSPVLFFPFVLTGGKRLHVFYDLHQMVNYFYPSSFFLDTIREIDKKSLSMHCLKGQKINFMGQILIMDTLSERHIWRKDM